MQKTKTRPLSLFKVFQPFYSSFRQSYLLKEFVSRDIRGRFAGSMAGSLWTIIHPFATILSYYFVFSMVLRVGVTVEETGTDRFVIFFLAGFFPWIMFADSVGKSVGIIVQQAGLITKVVFPVELLPLSTVISAFILQGIGLLIFLFYLLLIGSFHPVWSLLPVVLLMEFLFALGFSYGLAALCVFMRDTGELLTIIMMLWFFATPVIYPGSMVPENLRFMLYVNPMFGFVDIVRDILLKHTLDFLLLIQMGAISIVVYLAGAWFFMKSRNAFGDVL
ncbi:ABC-2 type transporter [Desulfamplus magnetovallimortis]|uniref:Transport permease protein n=1 Tax=Desulfamplus magnetovallimortis TaxID=1246637 RepID=A0A1W1HBT8_9BACT|nr:ABC transporter permease [Desulfamplus magnetovallimortis]SLM29957.1 ABC-2 type transporter [Desulfamplus magnetovallimortis]